MNLLWFCIHSCCNCDTFSCVNFISSKHPNLNFSTSYLLNGL
jgi:hypothetical protein